MEQFPAPRSNQTEPIEPEIVDTKPLRLPWWRRALSRVAASLLLIVVGVVLCLMGAVLTITFVGAPLGLPLIFIGLFFILMALFVLFAKGIRRF